MEQLGKNFVVSTADFAFYLDDVLACTGRTNLDTSITVDMQEQSVNAGKGNSLVYSYKYGRQLAGAIQAANWELGFIALNVGTKITEGLTEAYAMGECHDLVAGVATIDKEPLTGTKVAAELPNGDIVMVGASNKVVDLTAFGLTTEAVKFTYQYSRLAKELIIDDASTPMVGKLVLDADKHNNKKGKVGSVQIVIPSYQLDGNFSIAFTADGVTSTDLNGKALAVETDKCANGGNVYAYVREFDNEETASAINTIIATAPSDISVSGSTTTVIEVLGSKGALYSNIQIDNAECTFSTADTPIATVNSSTGEVTPVAPGVATIKVEYKGLEDEVEVTVLA